MVKKIILGLLALAVCVVATVAVAWHLYGERWQAEYREFQKTGAPVLMYHAVGPKPDAEWPADITMPAELFEAHIRYLKEHGYTIVTVEALAKRLEQNASVEKYVALSFDDGYDNNYDIVLPILQKYDAKASFFVNNINIGKKMYMDYPQLQKMLDAGMEIGSHTYSHNPLGKIKEQYYVWEFDTSRFWLKKKLNWYVVRTLAYPNGSYNEKVIAAAQKYGFYRALTGHVGVNTAQTYKTAPMEMYRVTVKDDGNGLEGFATRLERAYFWGFVQTKGFDINVIRDVFM